MRFFSAQILFSLLFLPLLSLPARAEESVTTEVLLLSPIQAGPETLKLVREAKKNIRVCLHLWQFPLHSKNLPRRLMEELILQAKKGLEVEVILDQGKKGTPDPNKTVRQTLFEAGVKIFEDSKSQTTRCNMVLVDDFTCVTGTFDWTEKSFQQNAELVLWVESGLFFKTLRKRFEEIKLLGAR